MMTQTLLRCLRPIVFVLLVWLAAACVPMPTPTAPEPSAPGAGELPAEAPGAPEAEFIAAPTPGPLPTPTPQPLAQPDPDRAMRLTQKGEALFVESDLSGAEAAFIDAVAADPGYLPAHLGLTRVYLYQPQYWQQALAAARAAEALAPKDPVVLAHLAWAQQMAHHFDEARRTASLAVELGPESALAHAALADVLISVYEVNGALDHARRATEVDHRSAVAWSVLGNAEFLQHNWDAAGAAFDRARELEPKFFAWHLERAHHELDTTGDVASAREIAAPALASQPGHAWSLFFLTDIAIESRDWEGAESACKKLMGLDQPHTPYPDPAMCMATAMLLQERFGEAERYQALAEERATPARRDTTLIRMRLHMERDQCQAARALAQDWLNERPYSVQAMRMIGMSYLCEEEYEQAAIHFRHAHEALPRDVNNARLLAIAYAHEGKASEAMAVLNEVKLFAMADPTCYQALYETNMALGKRPEALRAAQQWQVLRPNDTQPRASIALLHLLSGELAAARGAAESALAEGERSATLLAVLGETLHRQGDLEKAEEYLVQAVERNDNHYLARNFLARFYVSQEQCDKALPHLRWLRARTKDEEQATNLAQAVRLCELRTAPRPTPQPGEALDDMEAIEQAKALLFAAGAEPVELKLAKVDDQLTLMVAYTTTLKADSREFAQLERRVALDLARLLPRLVSQPDALVLLSGSKEGAQGLTFIPAWAAVLWVNGQLTEEEFEETWQRQE